MTATDILRTLGPDTAEALQIGSITDDGRKISFRNCLLRRQERGNITIVPNGDRYGVKIVNKTSGAITEYFGIDQNHVQDVFTRITGR